MCWGFLAPRCPSCISVAAAAVSLAGAALTAWIVYLVYRHSARLLARLGDIGTLVMMRFSAFVLLCIGIEILWTGWSELNAAPSP